MNKWDERFLELAEHIASWSKDKSTKVGAVIIDDKNRIISLGYNGFPREISDCDELLNNREQKYQRIIHAEENAILFAKQDLTDCSLYVFPFQPCNMCSRIIIQSGIKRVVAPDASEELKERWKESMEISEEMFEQAGVELIIVHEEEV